MFRRSITVITALLPALFWSSQSAAVCKQPVYVIAHRCNDTGEAGSVAATGVNAIEADFSYGTNDRNPPRWFVDHEGAFDLSTELDGWLQDLKWAMDAHPNLALIIFDIKDPGGPLLYLYQRAREKLGYDINLLFSIGDWDKREHFSQLAPAQSDPRFGVAIDDLDGDETQDAVRSFFLGQGFTRFWYGDGINAATLVGSTDVEERLGRGYFLRDTRCDDPLENATASPFHGVYTWTYEKESTIRHFLNQGVNGIMINTSECWLRAGWEPADVVAFAKTLTDRKYATRADNPFQLGPQVNCETTFVAECTETGGASTTSNPELAAFLQSATIGGDCNSAERVWRFGPSFYPIDTPRDVLFWAVDEHSFTIPATPLTPAIVLTCNRYGQRLSQVQVRDTRPPEVTCPASMVLDPVSPAGTTVDVPVATVKDCCDPQPALACTPSGTQTFAPGTENIVGCAAVDLSLNQAVPCSFKITIRSPAEVGKRLQVLVQSVLSLKSGEIHALQSELASLVDAISRGSTQAACNKAHALINKFETWVRSGKVTAAEAEPILVSTRNLRNTLGCR